MVIARQKPCWLVAARLNLYYYSVYGKFISKNLATRQGMKVKN
jgi:hypothetical protein